MCIRTLAVILLSALLTATASSQPAAKDSPKEKDASKEPKWPKDIGKKDLQGWLKTAISDKDAAVREEALMVIPNFSPVDVRKVCTKALINRIDSGGEPDAGVKLVVIDLLGSIGVEDPADVKEALRVLNNYANGNFGSVSRLHALQAIAKFGPKAHALASGLANSDLVTKDPSFEVRRVAAQTLGHIGFTEKEGPNFTVQKALATKMAKDDCLPVRLEALQSLFIMGPAWDLEKGVQKDMPPPIDEKRAQEIVSTIRPRINGAKPLEANVQAELWCRLVIIRFGTVDDMTGQLNGIADHLSKDGEDAVKYQTLFALRLLGKNAEPKLQLVANFVNSKETSPIVREAALMTLGSIGEKAIDPIVKVISDTNETPEMRIAALKALALLGEKAEKARILVVAIIKDESNLNDPSSSKIALLHQALITLAAMGLKAKPEVPTLQNLTVQLIAVKEKRMKSETYQKWLKSPETQRALGGMKPEEAEELLKNQNPEDQLKRFVEDAIKYIEKSEDGHPGGAPPKK
jgi:HEAT repeat protein